MSKKLQRKSASAANSETPVPPAGSPPDSAPAAGGIPWHWLALAVVGGGFIGWALANGGLSSRGANPRADVAATSKPSASLLRGLSNAPAPAPAVPGLTIAQSNTLFQMTNRAAQVPTVTTSAYPNPLQQVTNRGVQPKPALAEAPPSLLTTQTQPPALPAPRMGETLYNGIVLPEVWPPKGEFKPGEPMAVPYLSNPPPVIDISNGRQLFVDDFLIESNTLKRTWHSATIYSNNPVLKPDKEWETSGKAPMAMPFSDGVWLDPMNWVSPPAFRAAEVQDVFGLLEKLKPGTNLVGVFIGESLSAEAKAKIKDFKGADLPAIEGMQKLLAAELNRLIAGPLLHQAARFTGVPLSDRSTRLLGQSPKDAKLQRLNRWLLEDAFPRELFRMQPVFTCHYMAGYGRSTAMAVSTNGLDWEKPDLGVVPGSNLVQTEPRDSSTVWLDTNDPDPARRYKMWRSHGDNKQFGLSLHFSDDGIHWGPRVLRTGWAGDRTTVFYNPFRSVWVYSLRHGWEGERARRYWEVKDLLAGPHWKEITEPQMWVGSDRLDPMRTDLQVTPQLYNLDATAYESLMVGLFTIWRGDKNIPAGRPKPNTIWLGFSRDGYHWDRPDRRPFIDVSEKQGDWNWGNVQSVAGGFHVVGRNLYFYYSGRAGAADKRDAGGATGLAFLRRDGFASMDAGPEGGALTTRPVKFNARYMFANMKTNAPDGEMRVEILHVDGRPIEMTDNKTKARVVPFTKDQSIPMSADQTLMGLSWQNGMQDLGVLAGRTVRFRFHLKNASLYSFWVGQGRLGRSDGYVAAGGPQFTAPTDTIGNKSYGAFPVAPRALPPPQPPPAPAAVLTNTPKGIVIGGDSTGSGTKPPLAPQPLPAKPPEKK